MRGSWDSMDLGGRVGGPADQRRKPFGAGKLRIVFRTPATMGLDKSPSSNGLDGKGQTFVRLGR